MGIGTKEYAVAAAAQQQFGDYAAMDVPKVPAEWMSALQVRLARWQNRNFGASDVALQCLGVCEEAGELAHAVLKNAQGIRGYDDEKRFKAEAGDAIADCVVYLMQISTQLRLDFGTLLQLTAENVMARDWVKDPAGGFDEANVSDLPGGQS